MNFGPSPKCWQRGICMLSFACSAPGESGLTRKVAKLCVTWTPPGKAAQRMPS